MKSLCPRRVLIFYIDVFSYCDLRCPSCLVGADTEKNRPDGLDAFLLRSQLRGLSERTPFLAEVLRMGDLGIGDFAADFLQKQQTARRPRCVGASPNSLLNSEKFPVGREFQTDRAGVKAQRRGSGFCCKSRCKCSKTSRCFRLFAPASGAAKLTA